MPALLVALTVGCSAGDRAASDAYRGVPVARPSPLEVEAAPRWKSGIVFSTAAHDSLRLWPFAAAAFAPDGSLIVGAGPEPLSIAPDGRTVRRLGREGEGPGEYRVVFRIVPAADSTFLIADLNGRLTRIRPDGSVHGIIPRLEDAGSGRESEPVALLSPDRIVATWWQQRPNRGTLAGLPGGVFERDPVPLPVFDTMGRAMEPLGQWRGLERAVITLGGGLARLPPPFARSVVHAGRGDAIAIGPTDSIDVTLFSEGRVILRLLVTGEAAQPSRELEAAWRLGVVEELGDAGAAAIRALADVPRVRELPRVGAPVMDDERNVWVGGYVPPKGTVRQWTVYSPAGKPIGRMDLPAAAEAFVPGRAEILDLHRGRIALLRESGAGERFVEVRGVIRP